MESILAEASVVGILICYTNYYRANYMGIYGNFSRHFARLLITVNTTKSAS